MREPRHQVIADHVALALSRCSMVERTYAQAVVDIYHERTPDTARTLKFHVTKDPYADQRANCQLVRRMLDGAVRMPVELEEALVLALPQPYRRGLLTELAQRVGLLAAEEPSADAAGQQHQVADLLRDAGQALDKLSGMLDDGVLDERDEAYAHDALLALAQLEARAATLTAAIQQHVLGQGGALRSAK